MDVEQIKTFLVVANTKSFTRAAESLHVVQSTITARIKMLEKQLGKELFTRDKRNVSLTPAGMSLLPYAERIYELSTEGMKVVQLEQNFHDQLTVGTTHVLWDYVLFDALNAFRQTRPAISLRMITEHSEILIRKMMDGLLDVAIVFYPVHHPNLELTPIIEDTFELVAPSTFEIPTTALTPDDIKALPYIHLSWGGSFTHWIQKTFGNHATFSLEVDHVSLLLKFLHSNKGVGFLPGTVAKKLIQNGELMRLPLVTEEAIPKRVIYLLQRKKNPNSENVIELTRSICSAFKMDE
ncbi:LysR family transcriptional regulator [Bacillus fonticola]|uniref:LysR family transcriptional regulator n=1 Tax=Bacillus fonticola TaxID=2728853 RepID=UPI001472F33C|nr:LysR family transcriptional regulator [Bacillus fonticola]